MNQTSRISSVLPDAHHGIGFDQELSAVRVEIDRLQSVERMMLQFRQAAHGLLTAGYSHRQVKDMLTGAESYSPPKY